MLRNISLKWKRKATKVNPMLFSIFTNALACILDAQLWWLRTWKSSWHEHNYALHVKWTKIANVQGSSGMHLGNAVHDKWKFLKYFTLVFSQMEGNHWSLSRINPISHLFPCNWVFPINSPNHNSATSHQLQRLFTLEGLPTAHCAFRIRN